MGHDGLKAGRSHGGLKVGVIRRDPPGMIPAGDSAEVRPARAITEVPVGQPTDENAGQAQAPGGASAVRVPLLEHPIWRQLFPWLVQGVTGAGDSCPFDLALFGEARPRDVLERWEALGRATGAIRVVHGQQVHGMAIRLHGEGPAGLHISPRTDGHATRVPGVLLTVSVADCVPISLVAPERRAVALLHGGWRGIAAGIAERGVEFLSARLDARVHELHAHLGPAICGSCYQVGPEVHRSLRLPEPSRPESIDLRAIIAGRLRGAGIQEAHLTASTYCTLCSGGAFFSHRGGRTERQVTVLGISARGCV